MDINIFLYFSKFILCFAIFCNIVLATTLQKLQEIKSLKDVSTLTANNPFILMFLYKDSCVSSQCSQALSAVSGLLESPPYEGLNIVRSDTAEVFQEYSVSRSPTIIFFRKGRPIVYQDANWDIDEVTEWLLMNGEPSYVKLSDDNFEHLTQAATGATTGDWFVMFYRPTCRHNLAMWEALASRLKGRINVATVDISSNPSLKARFVITKCPTLTFFRLGKMYTYEQNDKDFTALQSFAEGWYRNVKGYSVPLEPSPFDSLTETIANSLKDILSTPMGRLTFVVCAVAVLLSIGFLIFLLVDTSKPKLD